MMEKETTSGLLLPLRLISRSLGNSMNTKIIRSGIVKMLENKLDEVQTIPMEEIPKINELLIKIEPEEPRVVNEVKQMLLKFHPNL